MFMALGVLCGRLILIAVGKVMDVGDCGSCGCGLLRWGYAGGVTGSSSFMRILTIFCKFHSFITNSL